MYLQLKVEEPQHEDLKDPSFKEDVVEKVAPVEEESQPEVETEPQSTAPVSWAAMLAGKQGAPAPIVKAPPQQPMKPVEPKPTEPTPQPQRLPRCVENILLEFNPRKDCNGLPIPSQC